MIDLVSLQQGKTQLQITDDDHDADIAMKIAGASAILMRYLKKSSVPDDWIVNTSPIAYAIPADVQHVTLLIMSELYYNRESSIANILSPAVVSMLSTYWDPAIA